MISFLLAFVSGFLAVTIINLIRNFRRRRAEKIPNIFGVKLTAGEDIPKDCAVFVNASLSRVYVLRMPPEVKGYYGVAVDMTNRSAPREET